MILTHYNINYIKKLYNNFSYKKKLEFKNSKYPINLNYYKQKKIISIIINFNG